MTTKSLLANNARFDIPDSEPKIADVSEFCNGWYTVECEACVRVFDEADQVMFTLPLRFSELPAWALEDLVAFFFKSVQRGHRLGEEAKAAQIRACLGYSTDTVPALVKRIGELEARLETISRTMQTDSADNGQTAGTHGSGPAEPVKEYAS